MFDTRVLVDNFDKIYHILILRLWYVIVNLEKLLNVLELCLILDKRFKQAFVLLITYFDEILWFEDRYNLGHIFRLKDFIHNLAQRER
jgi:hypothetical protein